MVTPKTFKELFEFYHSYVRILYSEVQAENELPQETLFEINAAFDHISRHWALGHDEENEVEKAFPHGAPVPYRPILCSSAEGNHW